MSLDSFPNFPLDTASQYGGAPLDDTVSLISGYTQQHLEDGAESVINGSEVNGRRNSQRARIEEDFDSVLDDLKDGPVDLPPHACRSVMTVSVFCPHAAPSVAEKVLTQKSIQLLWNT